MTTTHNEDRTHVHGDGRGHVAVPRTGHVDCAGDDLRHAARDGRCGAH